MRYYVNKIAQPNGDHEVHEGTCEKLPQIGNRIDLGSFIYCSSAVTEAKKYYRQSNGCYHCSLACHTS